MKKKKKKRKRKKKKKKKGGNFLIVKELFLSINPQEQRKQEVTANKRSKIFWKENS